MADYDSWLIVGLGNPGAGYQNTRHNLGFEIVDLLASSWNIPLVKKKFQAEFNPGRYQESRVILAKPKTFMNLSGKAVLPLMSFYKIPSERLVIIHDDIDLPPGKIKLKSGGGDGGHRGLRSIIGSVGNSFIRVRLGVGRPALSAVDHVLVKLSGEERLFFQEACNQGARAIEVILEKGIEIAMSDFN